MIHSAPMTQRRTSSQWPKISLVTPSYNQGQFLEKTIRSILDQGYPNLEYIIIDGGSQDDSKKIIKRYASQLKYWVSEPDKGQADAINKGFAHTTGEIMGWLNSDDVLMPGSLHLIAKIFTGLSQVEWISSTTQTLTKDGYIHHVGLRPVYFRICVEHGLQHGRGLGFIMQEGTFWRRSLWERTGARVSDLYYGMDFDLWKRFAKEAFLLPVHTPLAGFRLNPNAKSRAVEKYYAEVGVHLPAWAGVFGKAIRLSLQLPRKLRLTRQFYYDLHTQKWQYYPDIFSRLSGKEHQISLD